MSKIWNIVRLAVRNLGLHKLRVLLTALGLIFGVSSVIAMLAIAEGRAAEAQKQLAELGATNVILRSNKPVDDVNPRNNPTTVLSSIMDSRIRISSGSSTRSRRSLAPLLSASSARMCATSSGNWKGGSWEPTRIA